MMSTSTLLFLITCGQFLLSVQGLTLRLKGKEIIQPNAEVEITDLPVGGCRRYDTLECLSDVEYRGRMEKAYWVYIDDYLVEHKIEDIRCKDDDNHKCWELGWQSTLGIYKKDNKYYGVVRLGRRNETAAEGFFTCHFEGDSNSPISATIDCTVLRAPAEIRVTEFIVNDETSDINTTISWNAPCGGADSYTFYYVNPLGVDCHNKTFNAEDVTSHTVTNVKEIQIAAHRNGTTKCSKVQRITFGSYDLLEKNKFDNGCICEDE